MPTTRKILATLHSVLEYSISQDWVAANAARGVKMIGHRSEGPKKIVPPSKEDMRTVIEEAGEDLRLMLIFAASTGARAGEQWATRWRDVSFDKGELHIRRRVDAYGEEGAPKSTAGMRTVPLSAQLVAMLKAWKLKSEFSKPEDLIFPNRQGHHLGHDNLVKRQFLPLFDGLPTIKPFNWHGLRHSPCRVGSKRGWRPRRYRRSPDMPRCRSRWTATATCSRAPITARRWTRSPKGSSHDRGNAWRTNTPLPCAIHVTWTCRYRMARDGNGP